MSWYYSDIDKDGYYFNSDKEYSTWLDAIKDIWREFYRYELPKYAEIKRYATMDKWLVRDIENRKRLYVYRG